jgi:hypothetical protein
LCWFFPALETHVEQISDHSSFSPWGGEETAMFVAINQSETAIFDYKASWFVRLLLAYIRTQILEIELYSIMTINMHPFPQQHFFVSAPLLLVLVAEV